jgi:hypothetical protein
MSGNSSALLQACADHGKDSCQIFTHVTLASSTADFSYPSLQTADWPLRSRD